MALKAALLNKKKPPPKHGDGFVFYIKSLYYLLLSEAEGWGLRLRSNNS